MPPVYTVRAQVIDIRTDAPRRTDALLVDTNVWYWLAYPSAGARPGSATPAQMTIYSDHLQDCSTAGSRVFHAGLCLAELAHLIEQNERDIYAGAVAPITTKDYRHNLPSERARVVGEVQNAWARGKQLSQPLPLTVDDPVTGSALVRFATQPVDGYDLFLLEALSAADLSQVLSDDGDFCTVPGIQLFTANPRVVAAARSAGLLVVR
jgi:hypothetical protein